MAEQVTFSALNPRETANHVVKTLKRLRPNIVLGRFAQIQIQPRRTTDIAKWVRYRALPNAGVLAEGVPPEGQDLNSDTISTKIEQLGDVIRITDAAIDLHPDDIIAEGQDVMDEQILDTMEKIYVDNIMGGNQQVFADGVANRAAVKSIFTGDDLRKALLTLKKNNVLPINRILDGSVHISTVTVEPSYIGYFDPTLEPILRDIAGFVTSDTYASQTQLHPGEFGKFENCRFISSTLADDLNLRGAGNGSPDAGVAETGGDTDIYQIAMFGKGAYGGVPFGGSSALQLFVRMPKSTVGDPVAQQAYVAWKSRFNAVLLQQKALVRLETGALAAFAS